MTYSGAMTESAKKQRVPLTGARKIAAEAMDRAGLNKSEVGRRLGGNVTYFQQWLEYAKPRELPDRKRRALAAILQIDETSLIDDPSDRALVERQARSRPRLVDSFDPECDKRDLIESDDLESVRIAKSLRHLQPGEIIEREVIAGLGSGGYARELVIDGKRVDDATATWIFPVPFLRQELRANPGDLDIVPVDGTSMMPTLLPGDRVLVHRGIRTPSPDGIFAIDDKIGTSIKRLQLVRGSDPILVRIISDSDQHREVDVVALDALTILGRVICRISRL